MVLAIDIGNSEITLGLFEGSRLVDTGRCATSTSEEKEIADAIRGVSAERDVKAVALCSVVPSVTPMVIKACEETVHLLPLEVSIHASTGLKILYDVPEKLGVDRLVNAAAAWNRYQMAVIVVDFGTATTFDVINGKGEYLGGAIFPGLKMAASSLAEKTARLPLVELQKPSRIIGRSTEECIRSALYYGYAAMVEGMVTRIREEMAEEAKVLVTGGLAGTIGGECRVIDREEPFLTLEGLRVIYEREIINNERRGGEPASPNKGVRA